MTKASFTTERVVALTASVFLTVAFIASLMASGDSRSILPQTELILPFAHGICLSLAICCIFWPNFIFQYLIMQMEAILTILTNWYLLGIFLYYGSTFLLMCQTISFKRSRQIFAASMLVHILSLLLTYRYGWITTVLGFTCSLFYASFFIWTYTILKTKFSCFTPTSIKIHSILNNKTPGSELKLSSYNLSERQQNFIIDNIINKLSYKELSDKYFVSVSTVKKEFSAIFNIFGVAKQEELHILLMQYHLVK